MIYYPLSVLMLSVKWYLDNKEWMNRVTSGDYQEYYKKMY
jgi:dTDP-glucose 4,6-dehydratase